MQGGVVGTCDMYMSIELSLARYISIPKYYPVSMMSVERVVQPRVPLPIIAFGSVSFVSLRIVFSA